MFRTHNLKIAAAFLLFLGGMYFVLAQSSNPGPGAGGGGTNGGGPGSLPANASQFNTNGTLTIVENALLTNPVVKGAVNVTNPGTAGSLELSDSTGTRGFKLLVTPVMGSNVAIRMPSYLKAGIMTLAMEPGGESNATLTIVDTFDIAWRSNLEAFAVGTINVTNQYVMHPTTLYNGSNGVSAVAVTNDLDFATSAWKSITNRIGTNMTWKLVNLSPGRSVFIPFRGIGGYTNRMAFIVESGGTNIIWHNWSTNGSHDIDVRPDANYAVSLFCTEQTNVIGTVVTDDSHQPFKVVTLATPVGFTRSNAIVGGTVFVETTHRTNLNTTIGTLTNVAMWPAVGHTLTNDNDELTFVANGKLRPGTNDILVALGNATLLRTGQITNGGFTDYEITGRITRYGANQQSFVHFSWGPGQGVWWPFTNSHVLAVGQTNGFFQTDLTIQAGSMSENGISNTYFRVNWTPGPRF